MFTQFEWRQQHRKATHGAVVIDLSDASKYHNELP